MMMMMMMVVVVMMILVDPIGSVHHETRARQ
jgi:hypothetical protein